jgi:uncharacterized membrane protein
MELLIIGCLAFLATHLGISGTPLRGMLQNLLGAKGFMGVYSLLSIGTLILMIYAYGKVPHADFIWTPTTVAYKVAKVFVLVSFLVLVAGTMTRNPTAVMQDSALDDGVHGILKITRHPVQWAILVFAAGHIIANGDTASILFFGTLAAISFFGMLSMDARRRKEEDPRWQTFMETTSMVPFAAMLGGKSSFQMADVNWVALIVGFGLYAAVYWLHDMVSGGMSLF